jgi:hypothetical protein
MQPGGFRQPGFEASLFAGAVEYEAAFDIWTFLFSECAIIRLYAIAVLTNGRAVKPGS